MSGSARSMHSELVQYSREYFSEERMETAVAAWERRAAGDEQGAAAVVAGFYDRIAEESRKDTRAADVRSVAEDHGVAVVTAVRAYGNLGPFRPLNRADFKGARVFDVLLRPGQIACCSTVSPGDTAENLYSRWGVIIGEGKIHQAFPYDAVSSVGSDGVVRSPFLPRLRGVRPSDQLEQALYGRPGRYNEVNVSAEGIAGLFFCTDAPEVSDQDLPSEETLDILRPYGIPHYLLRDGRFYRIGGIEDIASDSLGEPVELSEIVSHSVRPTNEQRGEMIAHLARVLTLASRNSITSGAARGEFVYDRQRVKAGSVERFLREQARLLEDGNPSLRLYGAMALHAYAEAADRDGDRAGAELARGQARPVLGDGLYGEYKSRILPSGNLSITEPDLRHYLDTGKLPEYLQDH